MKKRNRMAAWIAALGVCLSMAPAVPANAAYGVGGTGNNIVEHLDRGIYAVKSGNGMFVSWRFNADDPDDAEFRLYRGMISSIPASQDRRQVFTTHPVRQIPNTVWIWSPAGRSSPARTASSIPVRITSTST